MMCEISTLSNGIRNRYEEYIPMKIAIVRHQIGGRAEGMQFAPDIVPMQNGRGALDVPGVEDYGEGDFIAYSSSVWRYVEKVNLPYPGGYKYTRAKNALLINNAQWDNEIPYNPCDEAVSHICGGNFITYDLETATHVRLVSYANDLDMNNVLNPEIDNWEMKPYMWWKAIAVNSSGTLINVGQDVDAFFPLLRDRKHLWMTRKSLEFFPPGYHYQLRGCNVYDAGKPLMTVIGKNQIFHTSWRIQTRSVIPPD